MGNVNHTTVYNPYEKDHISLPKYTSPDLFNLSLGETLSDVTLYYQPLPNPIFAAVNLGISCVILLIGEYVNARVLQFVKRETGLVMDVLKVFLYVQMVYWPIATLFGASTEFVYPVVNIFGSWFCIAEFFWLVTGMSFILFHSFVVGLMRYIFVVHEEKVICFGKEKAKKTFFWLAILVPCVLATWGYFNNRDTSTVASLNKCKGLHHKVFLLEHSYDSTAKRNFCYFESYEGHEDGIIVNLKRISCTLYSVLFFILGFNLVEGLLYWRTVKHSNRNLLHERVTKSLSKWHQNRRKRICQVNIKVNLIVWLVEFAGCMTLAIDFLAVGSRNNIVTDILGNLSIICFFILLPCTFLINCSSGVNKIADNNWFMAFTKNFDPNSDENDEVPISRPEKNSRNALNKHAPSVKSDPNTGTGDNESENKLTNQLENESKQQPHVFIVKREAWK